MTTTPDDLGGSARTPVSAQQRLRDAVVSGLLQPGAPLGVARLAEWLDAPPAIVRAALDALLDVGLAVTTAAGDVIVAPLTRDGARDLLRVYRLLAVTGYEWGAPHLDAAEIGALRRLGREFAQAAAAEDLDASAVAATLFHEIVLRRAGSPLLLELVHSFSHRADRLIRLQFPMAFSTASAAVHLEIAEAQARRDDMRAIALYCGGWERYLQAIERVPDDQWATMDEPGASRPTTGARPRSQEGTRLSAAARLRDAVIGGALSPGEELDQRSLAGWLDVDAGEVRRALAELIDDGLVVSRPDAVVVAPLTTADAFDLLRVIRLLMVTGYEWAGERLESDDIHTLWATQRRFAAAVETGDQVTATRALAGFQMVVMHCSGSPELVRLMEACRTRGERLVLLFFASGISPRGVAVMASMVAALEHGDYLTAVDLLEGMWSELESQIEAASGEVPAPPA